MCQPATSHFLKATVIFNRPLTANQYLLRLQAPQNAQQAEPGHFVHLNCHPGLTLPRPFSIMDTDPKAGTVDIFYQVVGVGTERMRGWQEGETTTMLGPVGRPFTMPQPGRHALLIAGGIGYAPLDFFARRLKEQNITTTMLLGLERDAPFKLCNADAPIASEVVEAPLAISRLDSLGIPSRISSLAEKPGFFTGFVTDLGRQILQNMTGDQLAATDIFTCGPTPMMKAAARLAAQFNISGQASLEEHMACGFGGCAGCVAPVGESEKNWNYLRVCTDGPVFSLDTVVWDKVHG